MQQNERVLFLKVKVQNELLHNIAFILLVEISDDVPKDLIRDKLDSV